MDDSRKNLLIDLILGLCVAVASMFLLDLFHAETKRDVFRILSDCFFLPGALFLGTSGLTWAKNGGVWDGLGFTVKIMIDRMKPNYEKNRVSFAEYREKREEKNSSPIPSLFTGLVYVALAMLFLVLFNFTA